jgi:tetratricopeptide (TPR) repeat protein
VLRAVGPSYRSLEDQKSGIRFEYPARWAFGENHLGYPAWGNALGVSIGVRAERRSTHAIELAEVKRRFERELSRHEDVGDIAAVSVVAERPYLITGGHAQQLEIRLDSRAGPQVTKNLLVARGHYSYAIVLSAPRAWSDAYEPILDDLAARARLIEPGTLAAARRRVETFPGMSSAQVELAQELASIGDVEAARQTYRRALTALPTHADARYGLARLVAEHGGDLEEAEVMASELWASRPEEPAYAALVADLRKRLGRIEGACNVLQETLDLVDEPPEDLREHLRALSCRTALWLDP